MNRLKYAYKFALIGILIVLQAAVLIYMLVSELNKNIDFTSREYLGIEYNQALVALLDEAQGYRSLHYSYAIGHHELREALLEKQTKVDIAFSALETVDNRLGSQLDTTWKLQVLHKEWDTRKQEAFQFEPERAQVAFNLNSRWIGEIMGLIQQVGNSSNLALDGDLDTSYLIDSVLRKLPGLVDTLGQAQGLGEHVANSRDLSIDEKERLLLVGGIVRSNLEQLDQNTQVVFRRNESVKVKLKMWNDAVDNDVPIFIWNFEQKIAGPQEAAIPQQLLVTGGQRAIGNVLTLYRGELTVIGELLNLRIQRYSRDRNVVAGFTVSILFLVFYLFLAFDISVRKGIYRLNTLMESVAQGELSARGEVHSQDEMGALTGSINNMLEALEMMYVEVRQSRDCLEVWNQELEKKVTERTASLRNLLDHAGQGFLSFGSDLKVAGEYSAECTQIFNREISEQSVLALLYPDDRGEQVFLEALFQKIFQEEDEMIRDTYFSLLPGQLVVSGSYIGVAYKIIDHPAGVKQPTIMLILTDQTHQKKMESQMQQEKNVLSMVVSVVTHFNDFSAAVNQYSAFCQEGLGRLQEAGCQAGETLITLFRTIHTFKGTFGQLGMYNMVAELHEMETVLATIREAGVDQLEWDCLTEQLKPYTAEQMLNWLEKDIAVLRDILGDTFFHQEDTLIIESSRLLSLEEKIQHILTPGECRLLIPELRRLRYKPFKELLAPYPEYILNLAERYDKAVNVFEISGGETLVDPLKYYCFAKNLVHVFRNAVAHGLETPDERLEAGKEEIGTITCTVYETTEGLTVLITDDGRGMAADHIREIAVNKGICDQKTVMLLADEEAFKLIFADGFSGAEAVSELSGRGVGLSAVRTAIEELGGSVQVNTMLGKGTEFRFFLPLLDWAASEPPTMWQISKPLLVETKNLLTSMGLTVRECIHVEGSANGKVLLRSLTAFVDVKGIMGGKLVLSADEAVVEHMAAACLQDGVTEVSKEKWLEHVLAKIANEIVNNALLQVPNSDGAVKAESLVTILAQDASARYPQSQVSTWKLETGLGWLNLSLIY
jgi:signal transduction histidine kinase/HAMP domain-containing protein